ncbi:hypothetical protein BDZ89DRAFT_910079, partial [Hymenopellis radicata]
MWVKSLLSEERPTWVYFANDILARATLSAERNVPLEVKLNIFLQSFNTKIQDLPTDLVKILEVAKETGVRPEGLAFSREAIRQRPIWYHGEADPRIRLLNHSAASRCLRENHGMLLVGQAEEIASFLDDPNHKQNHSSSCSCHVCTAMRENLGCSKPNNCMVRAKELLDTLPPKWDPRFLLPEDYEEAPDAIQKGFEFDRRITLDGPATDIFRIFTQGKVCNTLPDMRLSRNARNLEITGATDGSCYENGSADAQAGAGVYATGDTNLAVSIKVPEHLTQSNQVGEALA